MYTEHRIVDGVGNELPVGEVGEITVRYPDGAGEYWKDPIKTAECIKNGWFYTGDLGKLDEQGFLYIVGRAKDMIVSGGYNVFAVDVENVLLSHLKISDAAVVGLPDEKWGEKVAAVVVLKPNESVTEDEIMEFCKERMAGYKAPKKIIFEDIPRNLAGKVLKYKIVAKYSAA
jgi:acyl-CoA synthetase (AMP-forming)/AMP-acid ligase II